MSEARELLGVTSDTPPHDLRRAYMRAVRQSPPDRDPGRFRQVRTAFELLQSSDAAPDEENAVKADNEARSSAPTTPEPRREGRQTEKEEAWPALLGRALAASDPDEWEVVRTAFEKHPLAPGERGPSVTQAVLMMLALDASGRHDEAALLAASILAWIDRVGSELRALPGAAAYRWQLALEIRNLQPRFPEAPWTAIARALLDGNTQWASLDLFDFAKRHPSQAIALNAAVENECEVLELDDKYAVTARRVLAEKEQKSRPSRAPGRPVFHGVAPTNEDLRILETRNSRYHLGPRRRRYSWGMAFGYAMAIWMAIGAMSRAGCLSPERRMDELSPEELQKITEGINRK